MSQTYICKIDNRFGSYDNLEHVVNLSNINAEASYRSFFDQLSENDTYKSEELDVKIMHVENVSIPVLKNGSCAYDYYSSNQLALTSRVEQRIGVDAFIVVPEINRILTKNVNQNGLISALKDSHTSVRLNIVDGYSLLRLPENILNAIRQYDSHLSALSYWQIIEGIFERLGLGNLKVEIEFWPSQYECDIALKFTKSPFIAYVVAEKYLVADETPDIGRNRGIFRHYINPNPAINARLLIMGDSHAYTMMAQMCSHIFRETHFFWINRAMNDSAHWKTVETLSKSCDFIIEEMSERFFMANFCQLKSV